jgi:hypothetical protein
MTLLFFFACAVPTQDTAFDPTGVVGQCVVDSDAFDGFRVEVDPIMGTVVYALWDGAGELHYTDALGVARELPFEDKQVLVGFRARSEVTIQLHAEGVCSEEVTVVTGSLPAGLPEASVTRVPGPETERFLAMPVLTGTDRRAMVYETTTGEPVWHWALPEGTLSPSYRVHLRADGGGVLVNVHESPESVGGLYRVDWDGRSSFIEVPGSNIDFVEHQDGTLAVLSFQVRTDSAGDRIRGDRILELRPDGEVVEVWNIFDDYPHTLGTTTVSSDSWSHSVELAHANGLTYDAYENAYLVSLPDLGTVASVDAETGALNWRLGEESDFNESGVSGDLKMVDMPHSVQMLDDGHVLLFNRRNLGDCSGAVEVELSGDQATAVWEHASEKCVLVVFLGEAHRLDDGDTLMMWSSAGMLDIVGPTGNVRWRMSMDLGAGLGFVDETLSLGVPH